MVMMLMLDWHRRSLVHGLLVFSLTIWMHNISLLVHFIISKIYDVLLSILFIYLYDDRTDTVWGVWQRIGWDGKGGHFSTLFEIIFYYKINAFICIADFVNAMAMEGELSGGLPLWRDELDPLNPLQLRIVDHIQLKLLNYVPSVWSFNWNYRRVVVSCCVFSSVTIAVAVTVRLTLEHSIPFRFIPQGKIQFNPNPCSN